MPPEAVQLPLESSGDSDAVSPASLSNTSDSESDASDASASPSTSRVTRRAARPPKLTTLAAFKKIQSLGSLATHEMAAAESYRASAGNMDSTLQDVRRKCPLLEIEAFGLWKGEHRAI